ncbi:MAG: PAS domain S-box protein, partial [Ignavibacteriales bacterium]|nr:PAS domain S-box protein [Ignavibacteriales bacterium]
MKLFMHLSRLREKLKNSFLNPLHSRTFLAEEREHTERKGVEEKFRAHSPIRVGLKIVLAITAIEFVIMLALYSFGAETSMPQYLFALIDTLALSIAASVMIVYWVVNPMNRYYQERLQNAEMLHRKEEHHKVVVESIFKFIPEGVLVLTESLNLLKHNKAFEEIVQKYAPLLGYAEQELTENIVEQCRTKIEHGDSKEIYISSKDQSRTDLSQSDTLILEFNTARMFLAEEVEEEEARIVVSLLDITERKRAETRLKNSEQRYRNIIQTSMDGFWIADTEGRILDVNAAYCQLIGYEREELLNMSVPDVEEKETPEMTAQHIQKVMTKGYDRFETRHRRKDGQLLDFEVSVVYQLDNEDGKFFIFLRDITERKRAEEEINMLAHSLRSVNECVSITDMEDNLIFVNQSFLNTYGYTEEELIGKQISMVRSPNNPLEVVREILPATLRGGWKGELLNRKKDGT